MAIKTSKLGKAFGKQHYVRMLKKYKRNVKYRIIKCRFHKYQQAFPRMSPNGSILVTELLIPSQNTIAELSEVV